MSQQWDRCLTCGYPILPTNTAVGYAGPSCNCQEVPRMRVRASEQGQMNGAMLGQSGLGMQLQLDLEAERMRLAACGVAAMCNTRETAQKQRIGRDNPYWSASYEDICKAVDREMKYRSALETIVSAGGCNAHCVLRGDKKCVICIARDALTREELTA